MAFGSSQWMYATDTGYDIANSCRFNDDDSAYLSWTPSASTTAERRTWTFSCWVKLGSVGYSTQGLFGSGNYDNYIYLNDGTNPVLRLNSSAGPSIDVATSLYFRDPSAWYHIMVVLDTTQATASNRVKMYVNGEQVTDFKYAAYPNRYDEPYINNTGSHAIGRRHHNGGQYHLDGYLAEVNFISGVPSEYTASEWQALDHSTLFGETDETYGHWKAKEYTGDYGTNGFYLPFKQDYTVEGFSATVWTGNGTSQYIGGVGFSPDLVWQKERSGNGWHNLLDTVRGVGNRLFSNETNAESYSSDNLNSFDPDGFSIGDNPDWNQSGQTNVAWCWDMGGTLLGTGDFTQGTIPSTCKANTTYGQSIVSYTGTGTAGDSFGHGLEFAPEMVMIKRLRSSQDWAVYHSAKGGTHSILMILTQVQQ